MRRGEAAGGVALRLWGSERVTRVRIGLRAMMGLPGARLPGWMIGVLALTWAMQGCTSTSLLFVNTLARSGDYSRQADLAYGSDPRQKLDIYLPAADAPVRKPTLIFVPGGCWGACETFPKDDYRFVADAFTAHGYGVVIVNYRLYPAVRFAPIISDVRDAVEWVHRHGAQQGLNVQALVLMGHSAGAQMTALLTLNEDYLSADTRAHLKGFVGLAGPYDFLPFTKPYQPDLFGPESLYPASQPINFVSGGEPPLMLLYGTADDTVKPRNIINLTNRVQQQGGVVVTRCYAGLDHGRILGVLARPLQDSTPVYRDILAFLATLEAVHPEAGVVAMQANAAQCDGSAPGAAA